MTPEQKRRGAFEEFDELLCEGVPIEEALITAAEDNELKVDVFRTVAERELGDLNLYAEKLALKARNAAKHADVLRAITRYVDTYYLQAISEPAPELLDWLEVELGRELTADERTEAKDRQMKGLGHALSRDLGRFLRNEPI